jgi:hypothetical protein
MILIWLFLLSSLMTNAETQVYEGEARQKGKIVYREKHLVDFEQGKVLKAVTEYTSPDGKLLARLSNTFSKDLNAPTYLMEDFLHKSRHGVRYQGQDLIMFNEEDGKETTTVLDKEDSKGKLIVGGQGLHYYTVAKMEEIISAKKLDLLFLIPGRLDAYNFYLKVKKSSSETVEFDIEIDNWFLRMFAPKLELVYDRKKGRLLLYKGLSNLTDENKKMMNVEISYKYKN